MAPNASDADTRPYRPCVGIMLINRAGLVFVGNRIDIAGEHWQMPQGGIDAGETPEQAAWRELKEEVGTDAAQLLGESTRWFNYDLPPDLSRQAWKGRFRGQTQRWFAFRFTGHDRDIDLEAHKAEFEAWKWASVSELVDITVNFKRDVYRDVVEDLGCFAVPEGG
jgi:putative (di)nucleoside polyphosphate hydrolase